VIPNGPEAFPTGPEATALAVLGQARAGQFAGIRDQFTAGLRPLVTVAALQAAWEAALAQRGPVSSVGTPASEPVAGGMTAVKIQLTFERGALTFAVYLTGDSQLTGPSVWWRAPLGYSHGPLSDFSVVSHLAAVVSAKQ
jgi:hypothetical protein